MEAVDTVMEAEKQGEQPQTEPGLAANGEAAEPDYAKQVQSWATSIPIGLGLCPWAGKAHLQGRLRFLTCGGSTPSDVARMVAAEADIITAADAHPLSSTLIVCPHVAAWKDFQTFEDWVWSGISEDSNCGGSIHEKLTLVPFHPQFLRWRGLPEGIGVGSIVSSHWGWTGRKSTNTAAATIVDTSNEMFGLQKVKVRFHESQEGRMQEQFVPIDWFDHSLSGPSLPDNAMHRAPYPTVHLIRNEDMATLCIRDISRLKRRNAVKLMKLGWQGIEDQLTNAEKKAASQQ